MWKYRLIMEKYLNRKLCSHEHIHHIDFNTYNNNIDNLFLTDCKGHAKAHKSANSVKNQLAEFPYTSLSDKFFRDKLRNFEIIFDRGLGIYLVI